MRWRGCWLHEWKDWPVKIVSVMTTNSAGGAEFAAVEMLDALAERGHEVVMLSNQHDIGRGTRVSVEPLAIGPKLSTRTVRTLGVHWIEYLLRLRRALARQLPYDVLLVHYKKEQLMAPWLPRRMRPTLAWAEWGPVPYPMRRGLPRRAYVHASARARFVMAVSAGTKASVAEVGVDPDRIVVVPNAVDVDGIRFSQVGRATVRRRLGIPEEAFVVGCISRLHPKKRNDVVVEAVLKMRDPAVHLIIAGSGECEPQLRAQAQPLGARAHFLPTPSDDVADVLSSFDVSVFCPSPTEGAPRATILGMLAKRPCLATGPEGVSDLIRPQFGAIVEPSNDVEGLRSLLVRYRDDPGLRERQGEAARAWAEHEFARTVVARRIEDLVTTARQAG
jgi:glycosyltransferase involved in cell wall biosynthesis